ncbi:MAG TPA: HAMP domain-containing sensor histidine kinase [Candidatus Angelobacter sp.]
MRRSTWIFLAGILLPSLVLAGLAVRSARDQQVVLEHQQAVISQDITDALAKKIQDQLDSSKGDFIEATQLLLAHAPSPRELAGTFNRQLQKTWNLAEVGFAVDLNGTIRSPQAAQGKTAATFLNETGRFLSNRENLPIFSQSNALNSAQLDTAQNQLLAQSLAQQAVRPNQAPQAASAKQMAQAAPSQQMAQNGQAGQSLRQVVPQKSFMAQEGNLSSTIAAESDFRRLIKDQTSGALARFREDKLRVMIWYRPSTASPLVFGAQIAEARLIQTLAPLLQAPDLQRSTSAGSAGGNYCLAILDDRGQPVALSRPGFRTDWKHPLVATEIGEGLPHWEAALYLVDPQQISRSASTLQLTLGAVVITLVAAILLGGWLMAVDVRRQMLLAQQKTDFVSNVSHELKTPLTSIRMFADMLAEERVEDPGRRTHYLRIIAAESARLTRLINNVLDFARLERGGKPRERHPFDLVEITQEVIDTCRPHLDDARVRLSLQTEAKLLPLLGDRDAIGQIVLNLLSNAEKYGGGQIEVRLRREGTAPRESCCADVLDRGSGIPVRQRAAIFKPFYRMHDSLAGSISGSGLGLTLARHMAQAHGGNVIYSPREGGGSCFTLKLPLAVTKDEIQPGAPNAET